MARVHVLGAGTPTPTPQRFGTAHVLQIGDEHILFDCGPATTHKLVKAGIELPKIERLFFSHHHHKKPYSTLMRGLGAGGFASVRI